VVTYDKFYPQYFYPGVWEGISYDLIISVQGHEVNQSAVELTGKTLQFVEGAGQGQGGTIVEYDPETKAYYLQVTGFGNWDVVPLFDSRYDITSRLSDNRPATYNTTWLTAAPVVDGWGVVLTSRPTANVIVNVSPAATRTLNSDEAFNADAGYGQGNAVQVRTATDRALIQFGGSTAATDYWVLTLSRAASTLLSVDAFIDMVFNRLSDGVLSTADQTALNATNGDAFVGSGSTLTAVANSLASAINASSVSRGYSAVVTAGLQVDLSTDRAAPFNNIAWTLALTAGGITTPFVYTPVATDTRARVAAGLAAAINANTAAGFKAVAEGEVVLILDPDSAAAFTATLKIGTAAAVAIGSQAPQLLVTSTTAGNAFYAAMSMGLDTDPAANVLGPTPSGMKVRQVLEGAGTVEIHAHDDLVDADPLQPRWT
jgi:hypothetical protein